MANITIRFPGAPAATASSRYKIERTLDNVSWTTLAATQVPTSPYVSPATTLAADAAYRATSITLTDAASFPSAGYGYIDAEALIQWTGKSGNQLTGVVWYTGYGTYLANSPVIHAHESYTDSNVTVDLGMALYRISHIDAAGLISAPAYLPFFIPPRPVSSQHCVVVVNLATDLGVEARADVPVTAQLISNDQMIDASGAALAAGAASTKTRNTNAFGLAFFQCWKTAGRVTKGGGAAKGYKFSYDSTEMTATTIPDQDWVIAEDIVGA